MMRQKLISRITVTFALVGASVGPLCERAAADTIVLKNGRRIIALSVVEVGDKVRYQTSAGELTLPKSIVDHIEKGGAVPMELPGAAAGAASLGITAPAAELPGSGSSEIEKATVHDGSIDREYIAKVDQEARGGGAQAKVVAAAAHHAAAVFEQSR